MIIEQKSNKNLWPSDFHITVYFINLYKPLYKDTVVNKWTPCRQQLHLLFHVWRYITGDLMGSLHRCSSLCCGWMIDFSVGHEFLIYELRPLVQPQGHCFFFLEGVCENIKYTVGTILTTHQTDLYPKTKVTLQMRSINHTHARQH